MKKSILLIVALGLFGLFSCKKETPEPEKTIPQTQSSIICCTAFYNNSGDTVRTCSTHDQNMEWNNRPDLWPTIADSINAVEFEFTIINDCSECN